MSIQDRIIANSNKVEVVDSHINHFQLKVLGKVNTINEFIIDNEFIGNLIHFYTITHDLYTHELVYTTTDSAYSPPLQSTSDPEDDIIRLASKHKNLRFVFNKFINIPQENPVVIKKGNLRIINNARNRLLHVNICRLND